MAKRVTVNFPKIMEMLSEVECYFEAQDACERWARRLQGIQIVKYRLLKKKVMVSEFEVTYTLPTLAYEEVVVVSAHHTAYTLARRVLEKDLSKQNRDKLIWFPTLLEPHLKPMVDTLDDAVVVGYQVLSRLIFQNLTPSDRSVLESTMEELSAYNKELRKKKKLGVYYGYDPTQISPAVVRERLSGRS